MNLKTVTEVRRVSGNEDIDRREGDGWPAGGTWLFSEPQPHLHRLLDLQGFDGEWSINPVSPALANALADATGVRFRDLPFTTDLPPYLRASRGLSTGPRVR